MSRSPSPEVDVEALRRWLQSAAGEQALVRVLDDIDRVTRDQRASREIDEMTRNQPMNL